MSDLPMFSCVRRTIRRICSRISDSSPVCKGLGARTADLGGFTTDMSGGEPRNSAVCSEGGWHHLVLVSCAENHREQSVATDS